MAIKVWISDAANTANWDYTMSANFGKCEIKLNGTLIVDENTTNSGAFNISSGDYIEVYGDSFAQKFLNAAISIYITDDNGVLYNNTEDPGASSANLSTGVLYPTGDVFITVSSYEY